MLVPAALWNDLPLEDTAISGLLGVTRQQVINLRKVARERLVRRIKAFEGLEELEAIKAGYAANRTLLLNELPAAGFRSILPADDDQLVPNAHIL